MVPVHVQWFATNYAVKMREQRVAGGSRFMNDGGRLPWMHPKSDLESLVHLDSFDLGRPNRVFVTSPIDVSRSINFSDVEDDKEG